MTQMLMFLLMAILCALGMAYIVEVCMCRLYRVRCEQLSVVIPVKGEIPDVEMLVRELRGALEWRTTVRNRRIVLVDCGAGIRTAET